MAPLRPVVAALVVSVLLLAVQGESPDAAAANTNASPADNANPRTNLGVEASSSSTLPTPTTTPTPAPTEAPSGATTPTTTTAPTPTPSGATTPTTTAAPTQAPTVAPSGATTPTTTAAPTPTPSGATTPVTISPSTNTPSATVSAAPTAHGSSTSSSAPSTADPSAPTYEAVIHFVNDLRYNLYPLAADGSPCPNGTCYGGVSCLSTVDHTGAVWLNAGVSMGYGAIDAKGDVYRALKAQKAAAALSQLKFSAMSVDADMFRYGKAVAQEHLKQLTAATCANCNMSAIQDLVKPYQLFDVKAPATCSIGVIGIISKSRAQTFLPSESVLDEVNSIKEAITQAQAEAAKTNKKVVFVVIGEANQSMADSILKDTNASVVLHSGSLVSALTYTYTTSGLRATLPPANSSDTMNIAKVSLQLKEDCTLSAEPTITQQPYNTDTSKCAAAEAVTKAMTDIQQAVTSMTAKVGKSLLSLAGGLETCGSMSCAVGQLVADGVRAVGYSRPEATWNNSVRAVIIPANALPATVKDSELPAGDLTLVSVLNALQDDANMCRALVTGKKLDRLLEAMLAKGCVNSETFPQLSGLRVVVDAGAEVGSRLLWAALQQGDLSMWTVPLAGSDVTFSISMPCSFFERDLPLLDSSLVPQLNVTATDVWLSEGLLWHIQDKTLIPPLVEERFHLNIPFPSRFDLCEDMTAVTVCYTILVLGALVMIGYQGYQFWRFRTTLSYIR